MDQTHQHLTNQQQDPEEEEEEEEKEERCLGGWLAGSLVSYPGMHEAWNEAIVV